MTDKDKFFKGDREVKMFLNRFETGRGTSLRRMCVPTVTNRRQILIGFNLNPLKF